MGSATTNANLASLLAETAAEHPDNIAIRLDALALPYAAIEAGSRRVAGLLRSLGVGAGDRVAILLPNVPHFPLAYYGALRLGAVVVPMNPLLSRREVQYYLEDSGAKVLLAWHGFREAAEGGAQAAGVTYVDVEPDAIAKRVAEAEPIDEVVHRDGDDTAVLLYTSGTTGQPKGAELTHDNIGSNVRAAIGLYDPKAGDVLFGGLPFFHSFGQTCALNTAVAVGATVTLLPRFDAGQALEIIARDRVNVLLGVPTMYVGLVNHPDAAKTDVSSLRIAVSGGASLPAEVLSAFERTFGSKILEGYGLSETSPVASFNQLDVGTKAGSIGTPIEGVEMRVVADDGTVQPDGELGEIQIKGPNVMKGYWNRPDATAEAIDADGWFKSGDIGRRDEDGFYFIVDRKKDLIIRGGYNVYPREVEEVLYEHPAVQEVAVVGIPHDVHGEEVGAAVALKAGKDATPDELQAFVKEQVAAYKYPRRVWIVDELPKGPTGKILKREITAPDA
ncbi:MAG: long-chain fatty acid--CoA ligase [Solirubrobacteraceae bacterium]|nr:long-chain fatty acid--CoA ligase [Solirubrobacteraceae bacterium]